MSPQPPDFVCLVEANNWRWEPPAEWEDYTRVAHNWQDLFSDGGIEVYKHKNCPYVVRTAAASAQGDALLIQVYTQDANFGIAVVHAPHAKKVGHKGYSMYWLEFWGRVRRQIDPIIGG